MDNIYNQIKEMWDVFEENHQAHSEKGNKAAGGRARKAIGEIKKLVTEYRKASVAKDKQEKTDVKEIDCKSFIDFIFVQPNKR